METYVELDKNLIVNTTIEDAEVEWYNVRQAPFSLHGFYEPENSSFFTRVPEDVAIATSEKVSKICKESTGGRVRFTTNSPYIAIRVKFLSVGKIPHCTLLSSAGFDLYIDGEYGSRFVKEFRMSYDMTDSYEQIIHLDNSIRRSYTINFPLRSVVETLEIGLKPISFVGEPAPYREEAPMIFYGSSIVHGVGASRPGFTYPSIISRELNIDYRNIGFSGNALGETAIAEWLATLPMSVFVCDYDHNAPNTEYLANTHYKFYETFRKINPDVPYIMISDPDYWPRFRAWESLLEHRDVIMSSYLKARALGDKNVYFIDGISFNVAPHQYEMTLDSVHPNDSGYIRMADSIASVIRHILEKREFK